MTWSTRLLFSASFPETWVSGNEGFHLMSLFFLLLCSLAVDFWKLCVEEKQIGRSSRGKERMTGLTGWFKGPCFVFHFFLLQLNSVTFHYLFWFSPTSIFLSPNKKYDFFFFLITWHVRSPTVRARRL